MFNHIGLYSAFVLGVFHALEPGHGKTAIIGYLIGQRGSFLPALALGFANAVTHGAIIFGVAILVQSGAAVFDVEDSETSLRFLSQFAGAFIIALSVWLFYREPLVEMIAARNQTLVSGNSPRSNPPGSR